MRVDRFEPGLFGVVRIDFLVDSIRKTTSDDERLRNVDLLAASGHKLLFVCNNNHVDGTVARG